MSDNVFKDLTGHLDKFPLAFSDSDNEAAVELLKKLFTEEQAGLAIHLPIFMSGEDIGCEELALKMNEDVSHVNTTLETMVKSGLVYVIGEDKHARYSLLPFVPGILEFNYEKIDAELVKLLGKLHENREGEETKSHIPLTRIIPVNRSVKQDSKIFPYESVRAAVESSSSLCLVDCMCRTVTKAVGKDCGRPIEVCLYMNAFANYLIRIGKGRRVNVEEAMEILNHAEDSGLVHMVNNARGIEGICCCCGCCCMGLKQVVQLNKMDAVAKSEFIVEVHAEQCIGCEICIDRCWTQALSMEDDCVKADLDRCIGCGSCAYICPAEALTMVRRTDEEQALAENFQEMLTDMGWR
jgi:Na+-translocating ferredoxin:NAD+ oxidoreductase subunit B